MFKGKKIISTILALLLVFSLFPEKNYANATNSNQVNSQSSPNSIVNQKNTIGKITKELPNQRTQNSKRFQKDDGTYEVDEYPTSVHYLDNGQWKDIDNTLEDYVTQDKTGNTNAVLENKQNDFKVKISKNTSAQNLIDIQKNQYDVSWSLDNAQSSNASVVSPDETQLNDEISKSVDDQISKDKVLSKESKEEKEKVKNILTENEKTKTLEKVTSTVNFSNVFNHTDLQYTLSGSDIKENVILNKASDNQMYQFKVNATNVKPILQPDKSIVFYDSNDPSKAVFKIQAPVMYDSENNVSNKIDVSLTPTNDGYSLNITPNQDWLNSSDRKFPIVIDPSLQTSLDPTKIYDTFVAANDTSNKWLNQYLRVGQTPTIGLSRTYIKFDLPQLASGDMITNAVLNLRYVANGVSSNPSSNQVNVHNVTSNYDPTNVYWNTQPSFDPHIESFNFVNNATQDYWVPWDITSIAKQWYTSGNNYGLMLEDDSGSGYSSFFSSDVSDSIWNVRPQVTFNYINNSGLEDYWTYHSQNIGRAGTSYLNDYNGNLIFTHNDIDMNGSRIPISINHIFNSNDRNTPNIGYGNGWRLNINQRLQSEMIGGVQYYQYTDEDGTQHYFQNSSATQISDELNLGLSLIKETDGSLSIKDKKSNVINFSASTNDLNYIMDANGNKMTFTYGTTSSNGVRNITQVTDGAGRVVSLNYNGSGILTSIQDPAGRVTSYNYDGNGNLISITDPDGKSATYSYDGNHNLLSATNYDGYKIFYQYYGIAPYRISDILESNTDGTLGDELSIAYGNNSTTFTDENGRKNVYQFDNSGKTLCIKDVDGSAQYYQYGDTTNTTQLTSESKLEKSVMNLLTNHDAEVGSNWLSGQDGGSGSSTFSTEASYMGNQSLKINKSDNISRQYFDQWNYLYPGKTYTFSAYVKTVNVSNTNGKGAVISFYYRDSSGVYRELDSKYVSGTNDWQRVQVTFTLPLDASDENVLTRLTLNQESGTAYFDSMQLEEGSIANRYNLIENGGLSGTGGWSTSGTSGSDGLVTTSDGDHPLNLDPNVYQVSGVYGVQKKLSQAVNVKGKAGDIYTIGAWAKAYSVPGGTFQIQANFISTTGAQQLVTFDFNGDSNDWQYVSGRAIANSNYSRIDIYYVYGNNANTAYFDGAQLYKEDFGNIYQYDSVGNIVSTSSLAKQNSTFQYNGNNDLVQSVDPKGNAFKYEYDSKHNITRGTTATNIGYSLNYDSAGNPISLRMGDGADYIQSKADYTTSGNYIKSLTDSLGNTVQYNYDETKGLLNSTTNAKGNTTTNGYDNMDRLTSTTNTVSGQQISNSYSYQNDKMNQITHNGFSYNFGYDSLGNNTTVAVGNQNLITNTFEPRTSLLTKSTYGNGQSVSSDYDNMDRITAKTVGGDSSVGVTYDSQVQNIGWQPWVSDNSVAGTTGQGLRLEALQVKLTNAPSGMGIKYQAYVQNTGWQNWVNDGGTAGTVGQSLRMEAIRIQLEGAPAGYSVKYQVYADGLGWMNPVLDGDIAGTTGQSRRIEAIRIEVEKPRYTYQYDAAGNLAYQNDLVNNVKYQYVYDTSDRLVKVSDSTGNELGYNYDLNNNISSVTDKVNNSTHTTNYTYDSDNKLKTTTYGSSEYDKNYDVLGRLNSSVIKTGTSQYNINYSYLPGAMSSKIGVSYSGFVGPDMGWQAARTDGEMSGTTGQSLPLCAVNVNLTNISTDPANPLSSLKIQYQTYVSNIGWQTPVSGGTEAGNEINQIEGIKINLLNAPAGYHVWYQAHVQDKGWTDPVEDGALAGTTGQNLRMEALRIFIIKPGSDSKDSTLVGTINNNGSSISYTYDANGNIQTITQNGKTITYTYNELNEVTREDNQVLNQTVVYTYDAGGNITSKIIYPYTTGTLGIPISTINFGYGDAYWKDKLTSYNGQAVTYDAIGNPLNDGTYNYTWEIGRQLQGISGNGKTITYKYSDNGIRTQKTVNGVTTTYHLVGDQVTYETVGTSQIYYTYDNSGHLISMNLNGTEYYYINDAQGDIIGLFDSTGTQVVSYTYDTWGKPILTSGSLASTVGALNPYRYRGYRYDSETGLYYLQSRYYNPEWGRFINADGLVGKTGDVLSTNLYAYTKNNPVNMNDPSGEMPLYYDDYGNVQRCYSCMSNKSSISSISSKIKYHPINISSIPVAKDIIPFGVPEGKAVTVVEKVAVTATKNNYRKLFIEAYGKLPEGLQVHHTLPQKYVETMQNVGINIHEVQYLEGVDRAIHNQITQEWKIWDKNLGRTPSADDIINFAKTIDEKYGEFWSGKN